MRILHISTRLIVGGSQENTVLSCEGQARRGHEVHLAFGPIFGPEGSMRERVERFNAGGGAGAGAIGMHEVPHLVREVRPGTDRGGLRELERLIEELGPEVVHTHSSKAGILGRAAAWRVRKRRGVRLGIVHTIHGPPFMPVEGGLIERMRTRAVNSLYAAAERYAARRCDVIVSVADAMTEQFLARGIGRAEQYVTVRSGMELGAYLEPGAGQTREAVRAELGLAESDFVVGTVARLAEHKGHDDILDALGGVMQRRPTWKLLWVGDGWWAERLGQRVAEMGLAGQVVRTGLVMPERVPGLMRAMDVLCHASVREGLPRTVPQALLCGVCPVAYDVDGTGEVCVEMETGRLVRARDVAGLRASVEWLAEHGAERRAMAARGRAMCVREFGAERMVAQLEEVYARAVSGG